MKEFGKYVYSKFSPNYIIDLLMIFLKIVYIVLAVNFFSVKNRKRFSKIIIKSFIFLRNCNID